MNRRLLQPLTTLAVAFALLSAAVAAAQAPKATTTTTTTTTVPTGTTTTIEVKKVEVKEAIEVARPAGPLLKMLAVPPAAVAKEQVVRVRKQAINISIAQRYEQQFRATLRGEYQFLLTVCEPTKPQRKEIARAGERALKDAAVKVAEWQQTPRRVVINHGVVQPQETSEMPDPARIIRAGLLDAAKSQLTEDQMARFVNEIKLREQSQKEVAIRSMVAKLDRALFLSPDQREKITKALTAETDGWWHGSTQFFAVNDAYFPMVPDPCVLPVLSPAQAKVWQTVPRLQRSFWGGAMGPNTPLEDAELGDDDPK